MNRPFARHIAATMTTTMTTTMISTMIGVTLLLAGVGCTGEVPHDKEDSSGSSLTEVKRRVKPPVNASVKPSAPLTVEVTHVAGELPPKRRAAVAASVGRALTSYARTAFLGDYPRSDFSAAFGAFTSRTRRDARRDRALLTNRSLGSTTTSVRAVRRTAYLSVLSPKGKVSGATAAVDWTFLVDRGDEAAQRVRLKGRLLLTRAKAGRWAIFGYHVNRSASPARSAS